MKCVQCTGDLTGRQRKYCSIKCKIDFSAKSYLDEINSLVAAGGKKCIVCDKICPLSQFLSDSKTSDKLKDSCKDCMSGATQKTLSAAAKRRTYHLKKNYNITLEQYDAILLFQGGMCAVCGRPPRGKLLAVDHDHVTNLVRGLLCSSCNLLVIRKHRSGEIFHRAGNYLDNPPAVEALGIEILSPERAPSRKRYRRRRDAVPSSRKKKS